MHRPTFLAVALCAALALPAAALGKGATQAKVEGDGLSAGGIVFGDGRGEDGPGSEALNGLAAASGFYPGVFGQSPNPMQADRPKGDLGPRYTITYTMPGPHDVARLRQEVYPYADGGPVTYVAPGQSYFDGEETVGGWFRAGADLKQRLVDAGLPATPPAEGASAGYDLSWSAAAFTTLVVVLLGAALAVVVLRRRPGPLAAR